MIRWLLGGAKARLEPALRGLRACQKRQWWGLAKVLANHIQRRYGLFLPPRLPIPRSTKFPHPHGIVIGEGVGLGERVIIYQNVTLGGARRGDWQAGCYPTVGDDTTIFAGAVIVGAITVGRNCVIGANAVVLRDVPDGHTAVGAPARLIPPAP